MVSVVSFAIVSTRGVRGVRLHHNFDGSDHNKNLTKQVNQNTDTRYSWCPCVCVVSFVSVVSVVSAVSAVSARFRTRAVKGDRSCRDRCGVRKRWSAAIGSISIE